MKDEIIRTVLRVFSSFDSGFRLEGRDLVLLKRKRALDLLRHHSLDLLLLSVCDLEDELRAEITKTHLNECIFQMKLLKRQVIYLL